MLIADEVLTGFGRTGTWFAMEHLDVEPDVITMGKGATGGYLPFSITGVRERDVETVRQVQGNFNHGGTFSHHAVGAAAALATLEYMEENDLITQSAALGTYLGHKLREMRAELPAVGDVRGIGMMWGVEFVAERAGRTPYPAALRFGRRLCARCREMGVLFYPGYGSVDGLLGDHLMVAPPFIVTEGQIDAIVECLYQAISIQSVG